MVRHVVHLVEASWLGKKRAFAIHNDFGLLMYVPIQLYMLV